MPRQIEPSPNTPNLQPMPGEEDGFVTVENVPIFDEHETDEVDDAGKPVHIEYTPEVLEAIAEGMNAKIRDTGDYVMLTDGHTPDPDDPKSKDFKPDILGLAGPFTVGEIGREKPRACILARFRYFKDKSQQAMRLPRRSVEIWKEPNLEDRTIDPIALLGAEAPRRSLGMVYEKYSRQRLSQRNGRPVAVARYSAAFPGGANTFIPGHEKERNEKDAQGHGSDSNDGPKKISQEEITRAYATHSAGVQASDAKANADAQEKKNLAYLEKEAKDEGYDSLEDKRQFEAMSPKQQSVWRRKAQAAEDSKSKTKHAKESGMDPQEFMMAFEQSDMGQWIKKQMQAEAAQNTTVNADHAAAPAAGPDAADPKAAMMKYMEAGDVDGANAHMEGQPEPMRDKMRAHYEASADDKEKDFYGKMAAKYAMQGEDEESPDKDKYAGQSGPQGAVWAKVRAADGFKDEDEQKYGGMKGNWPKSKNSKESYQKEASDLRIKYAKATSELATLRAEKSAAEKKAVRAERYSKLTEYRQAGVAVDPDAEIEDVQNMTEAQWEKTQERISRYHRAPMGVVLPSINKANTKGSDLSSRVARCDKADALAKSKGIPFRQALAEVN